jgi:2-hydroxycyclohexanecarboxyl-CoA dehydrogenase
MNYQTSVGQRTAVVTGAGSPRGIGLATARRFAREGWAVALLDRDADGAVLAGKQIGADLGVPTLAVGCDVSSPESVQQASRQIADEPSLPAVGALANIAGIPAPTGFDELTVEEWDRVVAVNLTGSFLTCKAFVPAMVEGGYGRVVNMSSVTALTGGGIFSKSAYAAAKAGVIGLTRGLARELAAHGITVNAVAPGVVDTDIRTGTNDEIERGLSDSIPLKRQASPDEIAALFVWLSSADAAYITGTTQSINGGVHFA